MAGDVRRLLAQASPDDNESLGELAAGLVRAGHLGRRCGTRVRCENGLTAFIASSASFSIGAVAVSRGSGFNVVVRVDRHTAARAEAALCDALERLDPVFTWQDAAAQWTAAELAEAERVAAEAAAFVRASTLDRARIAPRLPRNGL